MLCEHPLGYVTTLSLYRKSLKPVNSSKVYEGSTSSHRHAIALLQSLEIHVVTLLGERRDFFTAATSHKQTLILHSGTPYRPCNTNVTSKNYIHNARRQSGNLPRPAGARGRRHGSPRCEERPAARHVKTHSQRDRSSRTSSPRSKSRVRHTICCKGPADLPKTATSRGCCRERTRRPSPAVSAARRTKRQKLIVSQCLKS